MPGASLSASSGTATTSVNLTLNTTGLSAGTYQGLVATTSAGAVNAGDSVPVTLTVAPAPPCTYVVNPTDGSSPNTGGSGGFDVAAGPTCAWTAVPSQPWVTITSGASDTGNGTVSYSVASNPDPAARNATINLNGTLYTITQFGTDCSFAINPGTVFATSAGGTANVAITASSASCAWTATSATLTLSAAAGTGNATIDVTVPPNPDPGSRILTATIGGNTFTVNQTGISCSVSLSPYSATVAAAGASGSVGITTPAGCTYNTVLGPSWISVTSGASGVGNGSLLYSVDPNSTTVPRTGSLTIGGQSFQITQDGLPCSVTLNTSALGSPYGSSGGAGTIGITTNGPGCSWAASSDSPWATPSSSSGVGSGPLGITIGVNGAPTPRSAALTVGGQTINVTQSGIACSYALDTTSGSAPATGGTGGLRVLAPSGCAWSATANDGWLSIVSSGSSGTGDVSFGASANGSATPRSGTLTVAGLTYTVNQAGAACGYSITGSSTSPLLSADGVAGQTFDFSTTFAGCSPTAVSYSSWITITSTSFGGTSGTVTYSIQPTAVGVTRTGTIFIGSTAFTVQQTGQACAYSLSAYGKAFQSGGGSSTILGSATAEGCTPDTGTDQPSFIFLEPLSGPVGNIFTLPFSISPYPPTLTTTARYARITFGGRIVMIKQFSW